MSEFNVLLSSAGRRVGLTRIFGRTLEAMSLRGRVLAADMSRTSSAFHAADQGFLVPRCTSPEFVPRLLEICAANEVRLVVPTIDTELLVLAQTSGEFARAGTTVHVPSREVVAIAGDKVATHRWLVEQRLPTVRQADVEEVLQERARWPLPLVVKPRFGSASLGVAVVRSEDQLRVACTVPDVVVQDVAPGIEYTIDVLAGRDGACLCAVPRRRLEVRAGEVSKAITERNQPLEDLAAEVCRRLPGARGAFCLQVFLDTASATMNVIEINARFGGGFPLSWEAGADYPRWIIEEILGLPSTARHDRWRDGVVMLRYDEAVYLSRDEAGL